jgi:hypothetical protein
MKDGRARYGDLAHPLRPGPSQAVPEPFGDLAAGRCPTMQSQIVERLLACQRRTARVDEPDGRAGGYTMAATRTGNLGVIYAAETRITARTH